MYRSGPHGHVQAGGRQRRSGPDRVRARGEEHLSQSVLAPRHSQGDSARDKRDSSADAHQSRGRRRLGTAPARARRFGGGSGAFLSRRRGPGRLSVGRLSASSTHAPGDTDRWGRDGRAAESAHERVRAGHAQLPVLRLRRLGAATRGPSPWERSSTGARRAERRLRRRHEDGDGRPNTHRHDDPNHDEDVFGAACGLHRPSALRQVRRGPRERRSGTGRVPPDAEGHFGEWLLDGGRASGGEAGRRRRIAVALQGGSGERRDSKHSAGEARARDGRDGDRPFLAGCRGIRRFPVRSVSAEGAHARSDGDRRWEDRSIDSAAHQRVRARDARLRRAEAPKLGGP